MSGIWKNDQLYSWKIVDHAAGRFTLSNDDTYSFLAIGIVQFKASRVVCWL